MIAGFIAILWIALQIAVVIALIWLSWRYFDRRYKADRNVRNPDLYNGVLEKTSEVFIDPRDGLKYRVYYNRRTGEREYIRED